MNVQSDSANTPTSSEPQIRFAGIWYRFLAQLIDGIFIGILTSPFTIASLAITLGPAWQILSAGKDLEANTFSTGQLVAIGLLTLVSVALGFCYHVFTTASKLQGTPAKRLLGIKVVDLEGKRLNLGRSAYRYLCLDGLALPSNLLSASQNSIANIMSSVFGLIYLIYHIADAIVGGNDPKKQTIHDKLAKTYVVYR